MPAKKCPYIYSKDEGHKYRLLIKIFYFFLSKIPLHKTKRWEAFLQPPDEIFLFFSVNWILKNKKHSPIPVNALSKFHYFVVYDAYSNIPAYLLKYYCQQLYFHVDMGATGPVDLCLVSNTKLSKWQYCNTRVDLALVVTYLFIQ